MFYRVFYGFMAISLFFLGGCENPKTAEEPLRLPEKEKTWVKTEKVEITKNKALAPKEKKPEVISANPELRQKLLQTYSPQGNVTDVKTCLGLLDPLDKRRMAVQREGGLWYAFERISEIRPHSDNGFQLDSHINKLIFSIRHLCKTSKGVPMDALATNVNQSINEKGKEGTKNELIDWGEAPKTADRWIDYAESSKQKQTRTVEFSNIEGLILQAGPIINLYEDLLHRELNAKNAQLYLTDATTLLDVLKSIVSENQLVTMALNEDHAVPYKKFRGEM